MFALKLALLDDKQTVGRHIFPHWLVAQSELCCPAVSMSSSRWCACQWTAWGGVLVLPWQWLLHGGWSTPRIGTTFRHTGKQWASSHSLIDTSLVLLPLQRCSIYLFIQFQLKDHNFKISQIFKRSAYSHLFKHYFDMCFLILCH